MKSYLLKMLAWFTWQHIQWILVQCLNDDGLYHALQKASMNLASGPFQLRTFDSITMAEAMKELKQ